MPLSSSSLAASAAAASSSSSFPSSTVLTLALTHCRAQNIYSYSLSVSFCALCTGLYSNNFGWVYALMRVCIWYRCMYACVHMHVLFGQSTHSISLPSKCTLHTLISLYIIHFIFSIQTCTMRIIRNNSNNEMHSLCGVWRYRRSNIYKRVVVERRSLSLILFPTPTLSLSHALSRSLTLVRSLDRLFVLDSLSLSLSRSPLCCSHRFLVCTLTLHKLRIHRCV